MMIVASIWFAAMAAQFSADVPVYAANPWSDPVTVAPAPRAATPVSPAGSSRAVKSADAAADARVWPDESQSIMRKFVCETHPAGLVYDLSGCGVAAAR